MSLNLGPLIDFVSGKFSILYKGGKRPIVQSNKRFYSYDNNNNGRSSPDELVHKVETAIVDLVQKDAEKLLRSLARML